MRSMLGSKRATWEGLSIVSCCSHGFHPSVHTNPTRNPLPPQPTSTAHDVGDAVKKALHIPENLTPLMTTLKDVRVMDMIVCVLAKRDRKGAAWLPCA